jgi:hypothetical protein
MQITLAIRFQLYAEKDLMLEKQRDFWPGRAHRKTDIKWDEIL